MTLELERRRFLGVAALEAGDPAGMKILGIACSPRKGKTTAASVAAALEAARDVSSQVEVELIELAGMHIPGSVVAGVPLASGETDDFPKLVPTLSEWGLITFGMLYWLAPRLFQASGWAGCR